MDVIRTKRYEDLNGQVYVIRELRNGTAFLDDKQYISRKAARAALSHKSEWLTMI